MNRVSRIAKLIFPPLRNSDDISKSDCLNTMLSWCPTKPLVLFAASQWIWVNQDTSVNKLTGRPGFDSLEVWIFLFATTFMPILRTTQHAIKWNSRDLLQGIKRPESKAEPSPPSLLSSAWVKNEWTFTSIPICVFRAWCLVQHQQACFTIHRLWSPLEKSTWSTVSRGRKEYDPCSCHVDCTATQLGQRSCRSVRMYGDYISKFIRKLLGPRWNGRHANLLKYVVLLSLESYAFPLPSSETLDINST